MPYIEQQVATGCVHRTSWVSCEQDWETPNPRMMRRNSDKQKDRQMIGDDIKARLSTAEASILNIGDDIRDLQDRLHDIEQCLARLTQHTQGQEHTK